MKKSLVVLCCSIAFLSACVMRKSEPITGRAFQAGSERVSNGERVYMAHCQKCHPAGEAGLGPAIHANPAPGFIKRFQMRHGLGAMPGFRPSEISRKDLHDVSKYLKAWKHY